MLVYERSEADNMTHVKESWLTKRWAIKKILSVDQNWMMQDSCNSDA